MTILIILSSLILLVLLFFALYVFYQVKENKLSGQTNADLTDKLTVSKLDWKVWLLIIITIFLVIFSFYTPFIFTRKAITEDFNFSSTGPIGDTIGGLMNPFITLAGLIVTGLAFYIQYKANIVQVLIFNKAIENEKNKALKEEKVDLYNKLSLIEIDIDNLLEDVSDKSKQLKEYLEKEKENPLGTNTLYKSASFNYNRVLKIDRISIYKAFKVFLGDKENWLSLYNTLYYSIDYLPEAFKNTYNNYEDFSKEKSQIKAEIKSNLSKLMISSLSITNYYNKCKMGNNYDDSQQQIHSALNDLILNFYSLENDTYNNGLIEIDLKSIEENVLRPFLEEMTDEDNKDEIVKKQLEILLMRGGDIARQISKIRNISIEFANNAETFYEKLNENKEGSKSIINKIKEVRKKVKSSLSKNIELIN